MAGTPTDGARGSREEAKPATDGDATDAKPAAAKTAGGFKAFLPLILVVVTMPILAFVTTQFILLPKIVRALEPGASGTSAPPAESSAVPGTTEPDKTTASGKAKVMVPLNKMLVNVSGTMGTRYLMTSVTLVGNSPDFKSRIEDNKDQLMDLATGTLSSKTISDLEKPGARNLIRSELITVLNNALGGPQIQEIYITELAIQ